MTESYDRLLGAYRYSSAGHGGLIWKKASNKLERFSDSMTLRPRHHDYRDGTLCVDL